MAGRSEFGVILVAAGAGRRFGAPKAGLVLAGRTLLERSAQAFAGFSDRVAVLREEDRSRFSLPGWKLVAGGERRRDSVAAGLAALSSACGMVLIHDAARPLVSPDLVQRVVDAARNAPAVVPGVAVTDTIKRVTEGLVAQTLDRASLVAVQTPQAFQRGVLERALAAGDLDATDEAALVEALGVAVRVVRGDPSNLKITAPEDLALAEALLQSAQIRYDGAG